MKIDTENNLSFLDTLSCGLGGLMVLFFIFAALKDIGAVVPKSLPAKINGVQPLKVSQLGLDKQIPPTHFDMELTGATCNLDTDQQEGLSLGKSNSFDSEYFGTYWDGAKNSRLEIRFSNCKLDGRAALAHVRVLNENGAGACARLRKISGDKYKFDLTVSGKHIVRVNNKINEYKDGC